jgi:hypothetical protein
VVSILDGLLFNYYISLISDLMLYEFQFDILLWQTLYRAMAQSFSLRPNNTILLFVTLVDGGNMVIDFAL